VQGLAGAGRDPDAIIAAAKRRHQARDSLD
jgi:hypothetical protein